MHAERKRRHGNAGPVDPMLARDGRTSHPLYGLWVRIIRRCGDAAFPGYPYWGGRGITVFQQWLDFPTFAAWVESNLGPCPEGCSFDRIDNDGNYEPGNVRWATTQQQNENRRGWLSRDLPAHIYRHGTGFRAVLTRGGVEYRAPTHPTIEAALTDLEELEGGNYAPASPRARRTLGS